MTIKENISWNLLRDTLDVLKSYRFRNLIDAKEEILNSGVYSEEDYYDIVFNLYEEERLKYSLFDFLKQSKSLNAEDLQKFSKTNEIELKKTLSLVYLLQYENLIELIKDEESKSFEIKVKNQNFTEVKPIFESVKVIFESNICSGCGLCEGICPIDCIKIDNGLGKIDDVKCIRCGLCYTVCPRSYLPIDIIGMEIANSNDLQKPSNIGQYLEAYTARTKVEEISKICQDGGIASTILYYLFDAKEIDGALGAAMSENMWKAEPIIMKSKEDVLKTSGTKYANSPNLQLLKKKIECEKLAVVGVPCMMQSLLKSQIYNFKTPNLSKVEYRIGIFCMESFPYNGILEIANRLGADINDIKKMDINKGKFFVYPKKGEPLSIPIKDITSLGREDCEYCFDLTSESADIAIGSIGSPGGWSTVLIRTEKGKDLFQILEKKKLIEVKKNEENQPNLELLIKIAGSKRTKCTKHISDKGLKEGRTPQY